VSLNLRCALQCLQALLPGMKAARFGRVVNMSSRAALGKELRTVYAATKAGLNGMAKVWAVSGGQNPRESGAGRNSGMEFAAERQPLRAVARQPCCPVPTTKMAGAGQCGWRFRW
jgi:short chain dehydrogenase